MHYFIIWSIFLIIVRSEYTLVWYDEFNGPEIDTTKWDYEINCWGGGNNEKQCYVNNATILNIQPPGILHFNPYYWGSGGYNGSLNGCTLNTDNSCTWNQPCTSARIRTLKSQSWKYARFVIRAKLPVGNFLWPAIWLLPKDEVYGTWAASGEIDIVEFRGQPSQYNVLESTVHYGGEWPNNNYTGSGPKPYPVNFTSEFHIFTLDWTHDSISWYIDETLGYELNLNRSWWSGKGVNPYDGPFEPFDQEFYLILNVAIAGNFFPSDQYGLFNPPVDSQTWVSPFQVDYVRIYQDIPPSPPVPPSPPLSPDSPVDPPGLSIWSYWPYAVISLLVLVVICQTICLLQRKHNYQNIRSQ